MLLHGYKFCYPFTRHESNTALRLQKNPHNSFGSINIFLFLFLNFPTHFSSFFISPGSEREMKCITPSSSSEEVPRGRKENAERYIENQSLKSREIELSDSVTIACIAGRSVRYYASREMDSKRARKIELDLENIRALKIQVSQVLFLKGTLMQNSQSNSQ